MRTKDEPAMDIYARVTQVIIEAIEKGKATYQMPWHTASPDSILPVNVLSQQPYRGVNVVALWASAQKNGFESGLWGTYRQWTELGAQVRKGERGSPVVFWKVQEKETEPQGDDQEKSKTKRVFIAKGYTAFNIAQVDGYTRLEAETPRLSPDERIQRAEEFFFALGADIRHGYPGAAYIPAHDHVTMPDFERFRSGAAYYATLGHELAHWSGAAHRLARNLNGRFGGKAYAMEELVAELGSAFLSAKLQLTPEPRTDHAGYVESWLAVLNKDKKAIFTAAAKAQQAVDWLENRHAVYLAVRELQSPTPTDPHRSNAHEQESDPDCGPEMGP